MGLQKLDIIDAGHALRVLFTDGSDHRFHAIWLRDNALDKESRDPSNQQRLVSVLDVPPESVIEQAAILANGNAELQFAPDKKKLVFPADWLRQYIYDKQSPKAPGSLTADIQPWDRHLSPELQRASLHDLQESPNSLKNWLAAVSRYGFALVDGLPLESGALLQVVKLFGFVCVFW